MQGVDAQARAVAGLSDRFGHRLQVGNGGGRGIGQQPAFAGQCDAACVALEQGDAEDGFQLADVVADRAGGEVQFLGGMGEILVPRGGGEHAEGGQQAGAQGHIETQTKFVA